RRHAADLLGPSGQAHLPVLPRRLPCSGQRAGPVGGGPPGAALRGRPALGRNLPPPPEQRRGTRTRNPLSAVRQRVAREATRVTEGRLRPPRTATDANPSPEGAPRALRGPPSNCLDSLAVITTDGKKSLDFHRYIFSGSVCQKRPHFPCSVTRPL